jgi:hypothetical protein
VDTTSQFAYFLVSKLSNEFDGFHDGNSIDLSFYCPLNLLFSGGASELFHIMIVSTFHDAGSLPLLIV